MTKVVNILFATIVATSSSPNGGGNIVQLVQSLEASACPTIPSIAEVVQTLNLVPREEGGWIRETFRSDIIVKAPYEEEEEADLIEEDASSGSNSTTGGGSNKTDTVTNFRVNNPLVSDTTETTATNFRDNPVEGDTAVPATTTSTNESTTSVTSTVPRSAMASMYYLINDKLMFQQSKFSETWSYYMGSHTVTLYEIFVDDDMEMINRNPATGGHTQTTVLGRDVSNNEVVQHTVIAGTWYAAKLNNYNLSDETAYALIGNQAGPAFESADWKSATNTSDLMMDYPYAANVIDEFLGIGNEDENNYNYTITTEGGEGDGGDDGAVLPFFGDDSDSGGNGNDGGVLPFFTPTNFDTTTTRPKSSSCGLLPTENEIVEYYNLSEHPEGGFFAETFRSSTTVEVSPPHDGVRDAMTSIYYMMTSNSHSDFHRLLSDETWNYYFGAPIYLYELVNSTTTNKNGNNSNNIKTTILGDNITAGHVLQYTVKAGTWFGAEIDPNVADDEYPNYALGGTNVGPGFEYVDWELGVGSELAKEFPSAATKILELTPSDPPTISPTVNPPAPTSPTMEDSSTSKQLTSRWLYLMITSSVAIVFLVSV